MSAGRPVRGAAVARGVREAVAAWTDVLPSGTTLARYGGEEFAVLLPGYGLAEAEVAIAAVQDATPRGQTFSAGIARWHHADDPTALIAAADEALYRAKRDGRNRIVRAADDDLTARGPLPAAPRPPSASASASCPAPVSPGAGSPSSSRGRTSP